MRKHFLPGGFEPWSQEQKASVVPISFANPLNSGQLTEGTFLNSGQLTEGSFSWYFCGKSDETNSGFLDHRVLHLAAGGEEVLKVLPFLQQNSGDLNRTTIQNTWILESSEYRTVWVSSIQMVKSCDLADHSNNGHKGNKQTLFGPVFRPPFENRTIWQPDTNLPYEWMNEWMNMFIFSLVKLLL